MADSALAGLPRLVRVGVETRWRAGAAIGTAVAVAGYWTLAWLVGEPVHVRDTALAAAAAALPTLVVALSGTGRRVRESLRRTLSPPRATLHETPAQARERRTAFAGVVLTGIVVLLLFDRLTEGGGVMAGLMAGLLLALGLSDLREAGLWDRAEKDRDARLYVVVRPHALAPPFGTARVYETPRPGRDRRPEREPTPFDLGI